MALSPVNGGACSISGSVRCPLLLRAARFKQRGWLEPARGSVLFVRRWGMALARVNGGACRHIGGGLLFAGV